MSYTVFALKWRPQKFDDIIGQPTVFASLKNALSAGKLANAYLFAGPRGVGKTSTARILAKSLNCVKGPTVTPCQECASCKDITQGRSLDCIEIDGASNRGIDEIRTLRENVKFAPASGKYKIYIIDEVHMLTTEAFNALLKTLEEPPPFVKFIFATTHPHKVIPTILSRCQRLDFRRIPVLEMVAQLERIVKSEGVNVEKEVLAAIARASDGSLRDAESVLDQVVSFAGGTVALKDVVSVLGLVDQDVLFRITDAIIRKDPLAALTELSAVIDGGKDISVFLQSLIEHFRNLMVAKITKGDAALIDLPQEICDRLLAQSAQIKLEEIISAFTVLINSQDMSRRLDSLRIPLEIGLVRLSHAAGSAAANISKPVTHAVAPPQAAPVPKGPAHAPHHPVDRKAISSAQSGAPVSQSGTSASHAGTHASHSVTPGSHAVIPAKAGIKSTQPSPAQPAKLQPEAPVIPLETVKEAWQGVISRLGKVKISVAHYLNEGELVSMRGAVLTVSFPKNLSLHKEALEMKENKAIVEKCLSEAVGAGLRINFVLTDEVVSRNPDARNETFVQSALDMFDGRILKEE